MIEARSLSKHFKDPKRGLVKAVDEVSFRCEPGRIYGLLGANGAGKTTTLRLLATLLQPSSGHASVCDIDVATNPSGVRARLGFMAASTALYGRMSAREIIAYFGRLHGMDPDAIAKRSRYLITELGMEEFADRRVEKYSTGMKQKLSIARTVVHDPQVLILDEPTLGLDVMTSRNILRFVRDCRDRGKTVIYSTHIMREVEKLCDRVGIIHKGRIVSEGSVTELLERHGGSDLEEAFVHAVGGEEEVS
jgi:sodium transport system ATP-binding protein